LTPPCVTGVSVIATSIWNNKGATSLAKGNSSLKETGSALSRYTMAVGSSSLSRQLYFAWPFFVREAVHSKK
jgi:hypothetical protein